LDDTGTSQVAASLNNYINGFSPNVRAIMERFGFGEQIARMAEKDLLYLVIKTFAAVDLSPERVDAMQMGYAFQELIRIGAEQSNEEAGEHFTPREVIKLIVLGEGNQQFIPATGRRSTQRNRTGPLCTGILRLHEARSGRRGLCILVRQAKSVWRQLRECGDGAGIHFITRVTVRASANLSRMSLRIFTLLCDLYGFGVVFNAKNAKDAHRKRNGMQVQI